MSSAVKVRPCHICGHDCTGSQYLKDRKGRYFHGPCLERARAAKAERTAAAAQAAPLPKVDLSPDLEAALSAEVDTGKSCPSCGCRAADSAVLCTTCGYNFHTGAAGGSTDVLKEPKASKAGKVAQAAVDWQIAMAMAGVGAGVAAIIGAFIWGGIAYSIGIEFSLVAIGLGFLCGFGALLGARNQAGVVSGSIAALATIAAVIGGKWLYAGWVADDLNQTFSSMATTTSGETLPWAMPLLDDGTWMTDEQALFHDVNIRSIKLERAGETLSYPAGESWDTADEVSKFPPDLVAEIQAEHEAMTQEERNGHYGELAREIGLAAMASEIAAFDSATGDAHVAPSNRLGPEQDFLISDYRGQQRKDAIAEWDFMTMREQVAWYNEWLDWDGISGADVFGAEFSTGDGSTFRSMRSWVFLGVCCIFGMAAAYKFGSDGNG